MSAPNDYLQEAADRVEAEARQMSGRAARAQLLDIAEACRELARQLAEPRAPAGRPPSSRRAPLRQVG
jgi:hypothetical protein